MKNEWPEEIRRGLRDLAEEPVAGEHETRTLAAVRGRMEKREIMFRWTRRAGFAGAAFALIAFVMLFVPISYDVCVGSVVEADWGKQDLIAAKVAQLEAEHREKAEAIEKKQKELRQQEMEAQERAAELAEQAGRLAQTKAKQLEESQALVEARLKEVQARLAALDGVVHASMKTDDDKYRLQLLFAGKSAGDAERITALHLDALPESFRAPTLVSKEIRQKIGGNVLAWASGGRIVIHAEGASPEELEQKIEDEFLRLGASHADATVEVHDDGVEVIDIQVDGLPAEAAPGDSMTIEITN